MVQATLQDEILVKFPDGSFKILQGGVFHDQPSTKVSTSPASPSTPDQNSINAEQILRTSGIAVDTALRNRALMVIVSCLKGLRTRLQAKDAFTKPATEGGLGFSADQTESVLKIIKEKLNPATPDPASLPAAVIKMVAPPTNLPIIITPPPQLPAITPPPPLSIKQSTARPIEAPKARFVMDVRPPIKLVSPAEELAFSLVDFRRISSNPYEAIARIQEKITTLGQQSLATKLDGIASWQQSEVVRTYAAIVEESMGTHVPYEDAIAKQKQQGAPTLSKEEFLAVIELNKRLRF